MYILTKMIFVSEIAIEVLRSKLLAFFEVLINGSLNGY